MPRRLGVASASLVLLLILAGTLTPTSDQVSDPGACIVCSDRGSADAILNVVLFIPFGIAIAMLVQPVRAFVIGSLLSFAIEVAQLWIPGRHTSFGDLIFNTAGTLVGVALFASLPVLLRPSRAAAWRMSAIWATVVIAGLPLGVRLLQPVHPPTTYFGQWTPKLNTYAHYEGRVLTARVGEVTLPPWKLDDSRRVARALSSGETLRVVAIAGPPPAGVAPIFAVADDERRQIMMLAADGTDLVYRYRTRGQELRLDSPDLRVADALRDVVTGDTLRLELERVGDGRTVVLRLNQREVSRSLGLTDTWGLLLSVDSINRRSVVRTAIGFAWIAVLLAPLAIWLPVAFRKRTALSPAPSAGRPAA